MFTAAVAVGLGDGFGDGAGDGGGVGAAVGVGCLVAVGDGDGAGLLQDTINTTAITIAPTRKHNIDFLIILTSPCVK